MIPRPRLLASARNHHPSATTLIWGPPGSGKTVLVHAQVEAAPCAAALTTITPDDRDAATLWESVSEALHDATGVAAPRPVTCAADAIAVWGSREQPPMLAFDDRRPPEYRDPGRDPAFAADAAVLHRSPAVQFVLATRGLPTEIGIRGLPRGTEGRLIGPAELAFTEAEIEQLLDAAGVTDSDRDTAALFADTLGWPAAVALGVRFAADGRRAADGVAGFVEVLRRRLLAELPAEETELLVRLCVERAVPALHTSDTPQVPDQMLLRRWEADGIVVTGESGDLLPHPLVTRAVLERLARDPQRRHREYAEAVARRLDAHDPAGALGVARRGEQPSLVAAVLTEHWPRLFTEAQPDLQAALRALPLDVRQTGGALLAMHAGFASDATRLVSTTAAALQVADRSVPETDVLARAAVDYATALHLGRAGDTTGQSTALELLAARLDALPPDQQLRVAGARSLVSGTLGWALLVDGRLPESGEAFRAALEQARLADLAAARINWLAGLALRNALDGRLDRADQRLQELRQAAARRTWDARAEIAGADIAEVIVQLEAGRVADAVRCFDSAQTKRMRVQLVPFLAFAGALVNARRPAGAIAVETTEKILDGLLDWQPTRFAQVVIDFARHVALRAAGRQADADAFATRMTDDTAHVLCASIPRADARLRADDPHGALAALAACLAEPDHPRASLMSARVAAARAHLRLGAPEATAQFVQALAIAHVSGLRHAFAYFPGDDLTRLIDAVRRSDPDPQIAAICDELAVSISAPSTDLTRRELEILALLDTPLTFPELALTLHVSPNTLKTQTRSIYRKLRVNSRVEAIDYARHHRLREIGE